MCLDLSVFVYTSFPAYALIFMHLAISLHACLDMRVNLCLSGFISDYEWFFMRGSVFSCVRVCYLVK